MSDPENVETAPEPAKPEKTFTQDQLEAIVKDRLEREKRRADAQAEAARKDAEAKALAEQGEFKTLAETRAARIAELEAERERHSTTTQTLERYQQAVKDLIAPRMDGLPDALKTRIAALDPLDALEWIAALSQEDAAQPRKPREPRDIDAQARGRGPSREERIKQQADELRKSGGFPGF